MENKQINVWILEEYKDKWRVNNVFLSRNEARDGLVFLKSDCPKVKCRIKMYRIPLNSKRSKIPFPV